VNICHPNARCVLSIGNSTAAGTDEQQQQYICQCNDGYVGDGFQCASEIGLPIVSTEPPSGSGCDVGGCRSNAMCVYDDEALKSVCVCNDGYRGDGVFCTPIGSRRRLTIQKYNTVLPTTDCSYYFLLNQMDVAPCPIATPMPSVCSAIASNDSNANAIKDTLATAKAASARSKVLVYFWS
jgi:hypothetical protein